jgi:methylenetetrahydrofolate reductase (NADPH)
MQPGIARAGGIGYHARMKIAEFYKTQKRTISFEFFPPKTEEAEAKLYETVSQLKSLNPSFVSVTYGAMGTTRANTLRIVAAIKKKIGIEAAAHLTCVGHTKQEIGGILLELKQEGVENIVALRGDPPKGSAEFKPVEGGFSYAAELVAFIRSDERFKNAFSLAVAGYPEGHVECHDREKDLLHLKQKVDAGADIIITQLFFDNADYYRFVEKLRKMGITIPVVPGIMPVTQGAQIQRFATMCGARIPAAMSGAIAKLGDDHAAVEAYGIQYATRQCEDLLKNGAPGIHFYTLNKSHATRQISASLRIGQ